jgi:hypothetical protein
MFIYKIYKEIMPKLLFNKVLTYKYIKYPLNFKKL